MLATSAPRRHVERFTYTPHTAHNTQHTAHNAQHLTPHPTYHRPETHTQCMGDPKMRSLKSKALVQVSNYRGETNCFGVFGSFSTLCAYCR